MLTNRLASDCPYSLRMNSIQYHRQQAKHDLKSSKSFSLFWINNSSSYIRVIFSGLVPSLSCNEDTLHFWYTCFLHISNMFQEKWNMAIFKLRSSYSFLSLISLSLINVNIVLTHCTGKEYKQRAKGEASGFH